MVDTPSVPIFVTNMTSTQVENLTREQAERGVRRDSEKFGPNTIVMPREVSSDRTNIQTSHGVLHLPGGIPSDFTLPRCKVDVKYTMSQNFINKETLN